MTGIEKALARIDAQLAEVERLVTDSPELLDLRVEGVSGWSIRLQLDHAVKVLAAGLRALEGETRRQPHGINFVGRVLMALDWIPRGAAKAPKGVVPTETPDEALLAEAVRVRAAYRAVDPRDPRFSDSTPSFPHPRFRGLTAAQGVRFLGTHTHHHWKIVRDIRRAATSPGPGA